MKVLSNKRIMIILTMVLAFAIACAPHVMSKLSFAADSPDEATVGTATLQDDGDTIFVRLAKNADDDLWVGYTVGNIGPKEDPFQNVDINSLTPVSPWEPMTGTVDKDIYVCGRGKAEIYVTDLVLTEGHTIKIHSGDGLDVKGGRLTASGVTGNRPFNVGDIADVTINGDVYCSSVILFRPGDPTSPFFGAMPHNPEALSGRLTVNGDLICTGSGVIAVENKNAKLTVTGDIKAGSSCVNLGSTGEIEVGGSFECGTFGINRDAVLAVGQDLKCGYLAVTDSNENGNKVTVGGNLISSSSVFFDRSTLSVAGSVSYAGSGFYLYDMKAPVNIGTALTEDAVAASTEQSYAPFVLRGTDAVVTGDMNIGGINILGESSLTAGDVNLSGSLLVCRNYAGTCTPAVDFASLKSTGSVDFLDGSSVAIAGDMEAGNVRFKGIAAIGGKLTTTDFVDVLNEADVTVGGDINTRNLLVAYSSLKSTNGAVASQSNVCLVYGSTLSAKGSITTEYGNIYALGKSTMTAGGDLKSGSDPLNGSSYIECGYTGSIEAGGDVKASSIHIGGKDGYNEAPAHMAVGGGIDANRLSIQTGNLTVGKDVVLHNDPTDGYNNGFLTIGGDFVNESAHSWTAGITFTSNMALTVGGNVEFGDIMLDLQGDRSLFDIKGNINAYRVSDISLDEDGEDEYGYKTYKPLSTVAPFAAGGATGTGSSYFSYIQPFRQQYVLLNDENNNLYYADISDLSKRSFNVQPAVTHSINYEFGSMASSIADRNSIIAAHSIEGFEVRLLDANDIACSDPDTYCATGWNTAADGSGDSYALGAMTEFTDDVTLYLQVGKKTEAKAERTGVTVSISGWTAGSAPAAPVVAGLETQTPQYRFEYLDLSAAGTAYTAAVPTQAGRYRLRLVYDETADYKAGEATCDFEIARAYTPVPIFIDPTPVIDPVPVADPVDVPAGAPAEEDEPAQEVIKNEDGSEVVKTVTENKDGSTTTTETITAADGSVTEITETVKELKDGTVKTTTKSTVADENGNVLSKTTEKTTVSEGVKTTKTITDNADGTGSFAVASTDAEGNTTVKEFKFNKDGSAVIDKFETVGGAVTIPATVKVNGVKHPVTKIAKNAFKGADNLSEITLNTKITKIGKNAFAGIEKLTVKLNITDKKAFEKEVKRLKKLFKKSKNYPELTFVQSED